MNIPFVSKPEAKKQAEPTSFELWKHATEAGLSAALSSFAERMVVYERRLARLEGDKGQLLKELKAVEGQRDQVIAERDSMAQAVQEIQRPESSDMNEAAKVLHTWGYSADQIKKAAEHIKQNEGLLDQLREEAAGADEPISTLLKKNRFIVEMGLNAVVGKPTTNQQTMTANSSSGDIGG